jgi:uncharacterized Zn-finger protein
MKNLKQVPTLEIIRAGIQALNTPVREFYTSVPNPTGIVYVPIASSGQYSCPYCYGMNADPKNMIHLKGCPNASSTRFLGNI